MTYFHIRMYTIIGAESFHCPVRDGKEWDQLAMVVRHNCRLIGYRFFGNQSAINWKKQEGFDCNAMGRGWMGVLPFTLLPSLVT